MLFRSTDQRDPTPSDRPEWSRYVSASSSVAASTTRPANPPLVESATPGADRATSAARPTAVHCASRMHHIPSVAELIEALTKPSQPSWRFQKTGARLPKWCPASGRRGNRCGRLRGSTALALSSTSCETASRNRQRRDADRGRRLASGVSGRPRPSRREDPIGEGAGQVGKERNWQIVG